MSQEIDIEKSCLPLLTLAESLRQYRHKNADGFVSAYEYDGTRKAFNELRQQLADVSNERDELRADRDAEKAMKAKAREQRDRLMTRCVDLDAALETAEKLLRNGRHLGQHGWKSCVEDFLTRPRQSALSKPSAELRAILAQPADYHGGPAAAMYEDGSVLTKADCIDDEVFAICCKAQTPLYRHAQPATAKVVLPESLYEDRYGEGWNACLAEVVKLNGGPS